MNSTTVKRLLAGGMLGLTMMVGIASAGAPQGAAGYAAELPTASVVSDGGHGCPLPEFDSEGGTLNWFRNPCDDVAVAIE